MTDSAQPARALEQELFDEWPDAVRALFDGTGLREKTGFTASLVSVDANGHVRTSLLGIGELYAPDSRTVCIALWPQARATRVLTQSRRAALTFVFDDAFYQVQLEFEALPSQGDTTGRAGLACFAGSIDTGEAQRVRYARLTCGITFELQEDNEAVLERWEQQIEHLKRAAQSAAKR